MATRTGSLLHAAVFIGILYNCCTTAAANGLSTVQGLDFLRDSRFDDLKVTSDQDGLHLIAKTVSKCAHVCSVHSWCTSFFFTKTSGVCTLHATVFDAPSDASASVGTRYYTNVVEWCRPQLARLYNRQAQMCMYIETDPGKPAADWQAADSACANMGMRLASNITPVKMDAILNVTKSPTMKASVYIGLWRDDPAGNNDLQWMDGQPLDTAALKPYWEPGQPNGYDSQHCVVIETGTDKNWLVDVTCGVDHEFVCELIQDPLIF